MTPEEKLNRFFREAAVLAFLLIVFVVFLFSVAAKFLFQNVALKERRLDLFSDLENVIGTTVTFLIVVGLFVPVYFILKKRIR